MGYRKYPWSMSYNSIDNNTIEEFYKPAINNGKNYKRIAGYFSPEFLTNLVEEIKTSRENNDLYIQILCSPNMSEQDLSDIKLGYDAREKIKKTIKKTINQFDSENDVLPVVSELIAKKTLDIQFVMTESSYGIFHDKKGVFTDIYGNKIAFTGSNNETINAAYHNYESFVVLTDWIHGDYVENIESDFDLIWDGKKQGLRTYDATTEVGNVISEKVGPAYITNRNKKYPKLAITNKYDLYDYQNKAIEEWINNQHTGLLEMATGTGKTVTALAALEKLSHNFDKLLTIIVVPQNELLYQWEEDIDAAGGTTLKCFSNNSKWESVLKKRIRYLNNAKDGDFHILVTRDTFISDRFLKVIKSVNFNILLIADEVHTFGSDTLRKNYKELNELFPYKLGVSATPFRKSSSETNQLVNFFDRVVFSYTLKEAIDNGYLNHYEYYPQLLFFDSESLKNYRKTFYDNKESIVNNDLSAINLIEKVTSTIINSSISKVELLLEDIRSKDEDFQSIVYCSPGGYNNTLQKYDERHIDYVSSELGKLEGIKLRKVRSQVKPEERQEILSQFKDKELNLLVAIKCLDQGINLKGVTDAYVLSSTDSETEFIQRRGRILRMEEGKPTSKIFDYVMLPQDFRRLDVEIEEADIYIIQRELKRMKSYMDGSDNENKVRLLVKEIENVYREYLEEYEYEFS